MTEFKQIFLILLLMLMSAAVAFEYEQNYYQISIMQNSLITMQKEANQIFERNNQRLLKLEAIKN